MRHWLKGAILAAAMGPGAAAATECYGGGGSGDWAYEAGRGGIEAVTFAGRDYRTAITVDCRCFDDARARQTDRIEVRFGYASTDGGVEFAFDDGTTYSFASVNGTIQRNWLGYAAVFEQLVQDLARRSYVDVRNAEGLTERFSLRGSGKVLGLCGILSRRR